MTEEPAQLYRAVEKKTGRPYFIEIFAWRDERAAGTAHNKKAVMDIWDPMATLLESGRSPEITELERVEFGG